MDLSQYKKINGVRLPHNHRDTRGRASRTAAKSGAQCGEESDAASSIVGKGPVGSDAVSSSIVGMGNAGSDAASSIIGNGHAGADAASSIIGKRSTGAAQHGTLQTSVIVH